MAKWRFRNRETEQLVERRALQKALFTGDLTTAERYLRKVDELIRNIEAFPTMGQATGKQGYRFSVIGHGSPGDREVILWSWDGINLVGEGIYQSLPPEYVTIDHESAP